MMTFSLLIMVTILCDVVGDDDDVRCFVYSFEKQGGRPTVMIF